MKPVVAAQKISKHFGGVQALQDVSLTLYPGQVRSLVGENGSGKSTLIKIIAGVHQPDSGHIVLNGTPCKHLRPRQAVRAGVQVIYQDFSLFVNLTVAENLALNTQIQSGRRFVNWRQIRRIAAEALAKVGHDIDLGKSVGELTVAEKQLIAIAKALLHNARVIVMDEPTTALTKREVAALFRVIDDLRAKGLSILFVSHKLQEVLEISDTITILRNGRKAAEGDVSQFSRDDLVFHMTGRRVETGTPPARSGASAVLFEVRNLTRTDAFEQISFDVHRGEILGITGLLGSGRAELALALFGLESVDSGTICLEGRDIRLGNVSEAVRAGLACVPEDRTLEGLFPPQSIERNIAIAGLESFANRIGWLRRRSLRASANRWMKDLSIRAPSRQTAVENLSGGNQQKVVLGKWLAAHTKLLILNGPTVGVDIGAKVDVHERIRALAEQGLGAILISDDLPELLSLCRRVLLMSRGRIVKELTSDSLDHDALAAELAELA